MKSENHEKGDLIDIFYGFFLCGILAEPGPESENIWPDPSLTCLQGFCETKFTFDISKFNSGKFILFEHTLCKSSHS